MRSAASLPITIRALRGDDPAPISHVFAAQGWDKPESLYEQYFREQESGARNVLIAEIGEQFAGYVTIVWESEYPPFRVAGIPEIMDFNVLQQFRRSGVGSALLDAAEERIAQRSSTAGICVGLASDYGPAHILYIRRGYIPDGRGLFQNGRHCQFGDRPTVNHDLSLCFTKAL